MGRTLLLIMLFLLAPQLCPAEFAGVGPEEFDPHYRSQKESRWCWASSAEMVLSFKGIRLPQEAIVQKIKGLSVNAVGSHVEILNATNGIFNDGEAGHVVVSGQYVVGAPLPTVLYNHLKQKKPVILTYQTAPQSGHAVVLIGIDATVEHATGVRITRFHVADPFMYRKVTGSDGTIIFIPDVSLKYRIYHPETTPTGIVIEPGLITGMILVDGIDL